MKQWLAVFIIILLFPITTAAVEHNEIDNILVIHSYHQGLQWTDSISYGINEVFKNSEVEIHYEYLDTKRNSGEEYYRMLVNFEHQKRSLRNIHFKLIICSDNNALRFIMENGETLYPGIPVVFCGINNFTEDLLGGRSDVSGVVEYIDYDMTLQLMRQLHPDRKNVVIILDKTPTGTAVKKEMDEVQKNFSDIFTFDYYQDFVLDDVPEKVSSLNENDIIFLLTFNQDREGNFISYYDGINMIRRYSSVPIYGAWDFYFKNGIIGGMLTTGEAQGRAAAEMALAILNGTPPESLAIITASPNRMMFDYLELDRFGIEQDQLPEDALIINQPATWFEINAPALKAAAISVLILAVLFGAGFLRQKQNQRRLKRMNTQLEKKVEEKTRALLKHIVLVEEKNRDLEEAFNQIRTLKGIIPICSHCKNIRNDEGYWHKVETYISENTDAVFSHGLCPDCIRTLYPDQADRILDKEDKE